jgi:hypothetical protein
MDIKILLLSKKTHFYREFQRQLTGIEEEINKTFETRVKELKSIKGV